MVYNVNFLISALIFLLMIFYHFLGQRKLDERNNRAFFFFLSVGILDVVMDFVCTILISMEKPVLRWALELTLVVLYLLQVLVPVTSVSYTHLRAHET